MPVAEFCSWQRARPCCLRPLALRRRKPPATLDDRRRIARQVDNMLSFPGQPISRADVERKFRDNVGKRWSQERTAAVLQALWALERTQDVRGLVGKLVLPA